MHGSNVITERSPQEAEIYGLKLVQLIIPGAGHQIGFLKHLGDYYNSIAPLVGENSQAYLGLFGVAGFLYLIFIALGGPVAIERIRTLSLLNLAAVLLGTIGGFSSIFSFLVSPTIRSYNRVCVYIGFFSLLSLALVAEKAAARWISTLSGRFLLGAGLAAVLWLGINDQYAMGPNYAQAKREFVQAEAFVAKIERAVPPNSAIYQFPYFPLSERRDYSLLAPYLYSKTLRWSFGSVLGRRGDAWHSRIAALPIERAVEAIALSGFAGAYVARDQIADRGASLEATLQSLLGQPQVVSVTGHAAFYSLGEYSEKLRKSLGTNEFERRQAELLNWTYLGWRDGFYPAESHNGLVDGWAKNHSRFVIDNPSSVKRTVVLKAKVRAKEPPASVRIIGDGFQLSFDVGPTGYALSEQFVVEPGEHFFHVEFDAPRAKHNIFIRNYPLGFENALLETIQN
jgi:phosphoglycerol transferase